MKEELQAAWQTNNRINLHLLDVISGDGLRSTLSKRGGRDVAGQFAHMHTIRVWHLQERAADLAADLNKFSAKDQPEREELKAAFQASGNRIEQFLTDVLDGTPKRRGFRRGIFTTLSYFIAHESHHRGSILLTLKQTGHGLNKKDSYGIWAWDKI